MIKVTNLVKRYKTRKGYNTVLDNVSFEIKPGINVGFLGKNGAGKSTLLRILGGAEEPTSGKVEREGTISWPIGFGGGFQGTLSGYENLRFVCRIYAADEKKVLDFVQKFSDLGDYLYMPVASYSSGMRSKLAFGLSMAIQFNYYLIDEVTAVGDSTFKKRSKREFKRQSKTATLIVVSHNIKTVKQFCRKVFVLDSGKILEFKNINKGIRYYRDL